MVPEVGYHIRWHSLWMEVATGVSMENFLHKGEPTRFPPEVSKSDSCRLRRQESWRCMIVFFQVILDLMHNKLNKTQVIRGAIFDLLTSQVWVRIVAGGDGSSSSL